MAQIRPHFVFGFPGREEGVLSLFFSPSFLPLWTCLWVSFYQQGKEREKRCRNIFLTFFFQFLFRYPPRHLLRRRVTRKENRKGNWGLIFLPSFSGRERLFPPISTSYLTSLRLLFFPVWTSSFFFVFWGRGNPSEATNPGCPKEEKRQKTCLLCVSIPSPSLLALGS